MVATDLDGTLLRPDGSVSERAVEAVRSARVAGVHVVPVTGRPPRVTWEVAAYAGLGPLGVCANGAALVNIPTMEVIEMSALAADVCKGLVDLVRGMYPDAVFALDEMEHFCYEKGFLEGDWSWDESRRMVDDIVQAISPTCMKLIVRRPGWNAQELRAALEADFAEEGRVTSSGLDWVEIGAPGISKAYATQRICDRLGVAVSEVMAVGDNYNDLPVLGWAGRAVAPANAIPEVLAVVDQVVPPNSEDGVAQLLEDLAEQAAARA